MQCDFDTIGTLSPAADIETALVIHDLLLALRNRRFHDPRQQSAGAQWLARSAWPGRPDRRRFCGRSTSWPRSAAKKLPTNGDRRPASRARAGRQVLDLAEFAGHQRPDPRPARAGWSVGSPQAAGRHRPAGRTALGGRSRRRAAGAAADRRRRSPAGSTITLARSTRPFSTELPTIGSVCSGGRYDNLAGLYTNQNCPASGLRWGSTGCWPPWKSWACWQTAPRRPPCFWPISMLAAARLPALAARIRAAGLGVEFYPEPKKLGTQLKYADQPRLSPWRLIRRRRRICRRRMPDQDPCDAAKRQTVSIADDSNALIEKSSALLRLPLRRAGAQTAAVRTIDCRKLLSWPTATIITKRPSRNTCAARAVPYVAVDEARRSLLGGTVDQESRLHRLAGRRSGAGWSTSKGRRFPSGDEQKQYWKNWSTRDDLTSLAQWERLFGPHFGGLFVFAYNVVGDRAPLAGELFEFRGGLYAFLGVRLADYAPWARPISPRWDTLAMPAARFRELAAPFDWYLKHEAQACLAE